MGYSDALVMAAAVAMQTKRIPLGFAVLELAKERFAELRDAGVRNILMTHRGEVVTAEQGTRSMHLLAEKIFPYFR